MKRYILILLVLLLTICACHHHSKQAQKELAYKDFLQQFPLLELPFEWRIDSLQSGIPDSLILEKPEEQRFIPDSIREAEGKKTNAKLFPIGRNRYGDLNLLLVGQAFADSKNVILLVFGQTDTLFWVQKIASFNKKDPRHLLTFRIDEKHLVHLREKDNHSNGKVINKENIYAITPEGKLSLILTNTNEPVNPANFYNPIDTFPQENNYSGDYTSKESGFVSIRDGDEKETLRFFIHLNKHNGDCIGELDGIAHFTEKHIATYKEEGGLCGVQFTFSAGKVTIKETGGCGAYRGISCFFDGTFSLKKDQQKEDKKKK